MGITERKARASAKARATADSLLGMTDRNARATATTNAKATTRARANAKALGAGLLWFAVFAAKCASRMG